MDTYFSTHNCAVRLFKEWEKHNSLIIAVDFDDTVFDFHKAGTNHDQVVALLKECVGLKFHIVVFTASAPERHDDIRKHMESIGVPIAAINKNAIEGLKYGHHGKIYFNILLDDRAGLQQAYITLNTVVKMIKDYDPIYRSPELSKNLGL